MIVQSATLTKEMANVETLKEAGNRYFKNEDYSKAIKCYKEGLLIEPGNPTLNCNLAQAYLAVREFAEAEVHAVVTLALQGDSVKGFYRATKAALGMAKKERALSYLRTGLLNCPKAEELKALYDELRKEYGEAASSAVLDIASNLDSEIDTVEGNQLKKEVSENKENHFSDADHGSRIARDQGKQRSRSTESHTLCTNKKCNDKTCVRSTSVNRSHTEHSKCKKTHDSKNDAFIDTLVRIRNELSPDEKSPQLKEREALAEKEKQLQAYMKDGTEALDIGLTKQASEKYKHALDIMSECNIEIFGLSEVDRYVLKYSLSISWIETLNYNNIIQSVGCLREIETNHATDFPAVYYGLGQAFYRLNRFKMAMKHLGKAIEVIQNNLSIIPRRWPGTMKTITETTEIGLKESIEKLTYECKMYRDPDAICRYKKCLTVSPHICPSEIIFCSDPDFIGYVVIICQENCKITYHVGCWKHYKENQSLIGKLTDKDMLGQACLTSDCVTERKEISVIVRIEVYEDDGKIKTSCSREPTRTDNVNEHRKEKKKKNEKTEKHIKIKPTRPRVRKITPTTQNTIKKVKRKITISSEEFGNSLQRLAELREIISNFDEITPWDPQRNYFGRQDIAELKSFLNPGSNNDSETLKERKDFIFTYFYEYLNDEGPQKISMIEKKWQEDVSLFQGTNDFIAQHDGMCDFLLQSYRFACLDDYLCLADHLTDTYSRVREEVGESISFILNHTSQSIDIELDGDSSFTNKYDDKLMEATALNNTTSDFHGCERTNSRTTNSSNSPGKILGSHRGSICDSSMTQEASGTSSDDETDCDEIESTDTENEIHYENEKKSSSFQDDFQDDELCNMQDHLLTVELPSRNFKEDTHLVNGVLPKEAEAFNINTEEHNNCSFSSDVAVQCPDQLLSLPVMKNSITQTDCYDFPKQIENLSTLNIKLKEESTAWNSEKQNLIDGFQKEMEDYQRKLQMCENKISNLMAEKEKNINDFQQEIAVRDSKLEIMNKEHQEKIDILSKKREEDAYVLKKNIESMTELHKEVEKQANTINRLEGQLRKSNEQVLNVRKSFGEFKLDSYLAKCKERLHFMNVVTEFLQEASTPSMEDMKNAIECWETVARELQDTRDLLQVQYEILSQQLKNKVSSDCLLQLELAELPKEPRYPLQDMDSIIHLALEYVQHKKCKDKGNVTAEFITKNKNNNNNNSHFLNQSNPYPPPLLANTSHQSRGDFYSMMSSNSYGYRPPFLTNHYSAYPKAAMPLSQTNQYFRPYNPNENSTGTMTSSWPPEFPAPSTRRDASENIGFGEKLLSGVSGSKIDNLSNNMTNSCTHETLPSEESETRGTSTRTSDAKGVLDDTCNGISMKKKQSSLTSGLTPIEVKKSGLADAKTIPPLLFKPINLEPKHFPEAQNRWNYQRLMEELQINFKMMSETELSECLFIIREKNGNKLSGLPVPTIIYRVEKMLEEISNKKMGNMGMDKFGDNAWGEVKENDINWQNDDQENECIICHINMDNKKTKLQCKHSFHTECIRKWLHNNSTCPICRKYTRLVDEFPPLG